MKVNERQAVHAGGRHPTRPRVGLVGTYPPTRCGIATFTAALRDSLGCECGVVAAVDEPGSLEFGPEVVAELAPGDELSMVAAADALEPFDAVLLQHEFGIYGGEDGMEVLQLVDLLTPPLVVVLHTVRRRPTRHQRRIVEELGAAAAVVVVQSQAARIWLLNEHDIDPGRVRVVSHGAATNIRREQPANHRPIILTWGLLGPDKGIEYAIDAVAALRDLHPMPRYIVRGQTHPRVIEQDGERYRHRLEARVRRLGADDVVSFDDRYLSRSQVLAGIREADVVLLPYRSRDQVVSGVLVEAIASGKPVVATSFPHAVELLSLGSGLVVPHEDERAMEAALRSLLTDPRLAAAARAVATRQASELSWTAVGRRYREMISHLAPVGAAR
jgi:polysaccharide biosynthesis protein PslF